MEPLGRLQSAQEVAEAVLYLASPRASFCSGVILPIDGGRVNVAPTGAAPGK